MIAVKVAEQFRMGARPIMPMKTVSAATLAGILVPAATPAFAAKWQVQGTGRMFQSPPFGIEPVLQGVPFNDAPVFFALTIDDGVVPFDNMPPGGIGQSRTYPAAVTDFFLTIGSANIVRKATAPGSLFILNDAGVSPTIRLDQLSYSESAQFSLGVVSPWMETDATLPPNGFISGFNFGRSATTTAPAVPGLLTSVDFPPLDAVWQPHPTEMFLTLEVRAGTPTTFSQYAQLPRARFTTAQLQFTVQRLDDTPAVPEPGSWALLIAGFGLVGAAVRRKDRLPA